MKKMDPAEFFRRLPTPRVWPNAATPAYDPQMDVVIMPPRSRFKDDGDYYASLAHEYAHWTMRRLGRDYGAREKGDQGYALEEITADLAAARLLTHLDVVDDEEKHRKYVNGWFEAIPRQYIPAALPVINRKANQIVDYLLKQAA